MPHRQRGARQRYSAKPKNNLGLAIGAVAAVGSLLVFGVVGILATPPKRDGDLCIRGEAPVAIVAVVVDASGEFSEIQQEALIDRFQRALAHLSPPESATRLVAAETRVDLYDASTSAGRSLEPVFSMCAPAPLVGMSAIAGNARRVEREYHTEFVEPLLAELRGLVGRPESDRSPILESVTAAVEHSFLGRTTQNQQAVLVVSDFLQNSSVISFYRSGIPDFEDFSASPAFNAVRPDMKGADFCPIIITRTSAVEDRLQTIALFRWWEEYASSNRGRFDAFCTREFQL